MMKTVTLTEMDVLTGSLKLYRVSGVGDEPFWPHDGDVIDENQIPWIRVNKGWHVEVVPRKEIVQQPL